MPPVHACAHMRLARHAAGESRIPVRAQAMLQYARVGGPPQDSHVARASGTATGHRARAAASSRSPLRRAGSRGAPRRAPPRRWGPCARGLARRGVRPGWSLSRTLRIRRATSGSASRGIWWVVWRQVAKRLEGVSDLSRKCHNIIGMTRRVKTTQTKRWTVAMIRRWLALTALRRSPGTARSLPNKQTGAPVERERCSS